jgi:DNA-binding MarR family transcriptional regulator
MKWGAAVQPKPAATKPKSTEAGFSDRQMAVLRALRSLKDKKNRVEVPVAKIAQTSSVPLGSVHSILASLEKKHMIKTERQGSPKASAIYEVLPASPKSTRSLNGGSHRKVPHTPAAR